MPPLAPRLSHVGGCSSWIFFLSLLLNFLFCMCLSLSSWILTFIISQSRESSFSQFYSPPPPAAHNSTDLARDMILHRPSLYPVSFCGHMSSLADKKKKKKKKKSEIMLQIWSAAEAEHESMKGLLVQNEDGSLVGLDSLFPLPLPDQIFCTSDQHTSLPLPLTRLVKGQGHQHHCQGC